MSESNYVIDPADERALREQLENAEYDCEMYLSELTDLRRKLAIAEQALEKYADRNAWYQSHDDLECTYDSFDEDRHGWQDARDALDAMKGGA